MLLLAKFLLTAPRTASSYFDFNGGTNSEAIRIFAVGAVGDYLSLLTTRCLVQFIRGGSQALAKVVAILLLDGVLTLLLTVPATYMFDRYFNHTQQEIKAIHGIADSERYTQPAPINPLMNRAEETSSLPDYVALRNRGRPDVLNPYFYPQLRPYIQQMGIPLLPGIFTSIWLWLYAGSGFLLKAARRFDIGFDWFNRHFDIEHKPLQSIGLVAGALVALLYWAAVILSRAVR